MLYLLFGLFIGFSIGITIGTVGILCLRLSLTKGIWAALTVGIGASISHLVFGAIAVFGLHFVQPFFDTYGAYIRLAGSLFILYIALQIARNPIRINDTATKLISNGTAFFSALLINFSNPISIASYAAFMTLIELKIYTFMQAIWFLSGIFIGNLVWWILLATTGNYIKAFLTPKYLQYINKGTALLLIATALFGIGIALIGLLR